ncbi:hypothetical protein [Dyella sp.]|uniref:hypothetical protein n=1 Tax=Dyella sp. TaxID=1869338 RepID=UPI002FDA62A1
MSLTIGLTAYHATGNLVFVRVPSERGRYMLTDASVILVPCAHCGAIVGEPCRGLYGDPHAHGVSVHVHRKGDARHAFGHGYGARVARLSRLRLHADDVAAALRDGVDAASPPGGVDIDFSVVRKGIAA